MTTHVRNARNSKYMFFMFSYQSVLNNFTAYCLIQTKIPPNRHANGSKSKYGDVIEELRQKEAELKETKYLLRTAEEDVQLHANNLGAMETLMSKQLAQLGAELQATQEELAVKTSQVKQYQMQVEMYRLQVFFF